MSSNVSTLIVAIIGLIVPAVTAMINQHYAIKMKEIEIEYDKYKNMHLYKRDLIEAFIESTTPIVFDEVNPDKLNKMIEERSDNMYRTFHKLIPYLTDFDVSFVYRFIKDRNIYWDKDTSSSPDQRNIIDLLSKLLNDETNNNNK